MSQWKYEDFYKAIVELQGKVRQLENWKCETTLTTLQHRRALGDVVQALENGLTESPIPWTHEMKRIWKEVNARARTPQSKNVLKNLKDLPY